jgi:hypothetical protein
MSCAVSTSISGESLRRRGLGTNLSCVRYIPRRQSGKKSGHVEHFINNVINKMLVSNSALQADLGTCETPLSRSR